MWGKVLFAIVMFIGVIVSFAEGHYSRSLFFAIILGIIVWIIKTRPREQLDRDVRR